MTFGLDIRNAAGGVTYASTDVTWNQVDMILVPGGGSASKSYAALTGRQVLCVQLMINPPPVNRRALAHNISVSGINVSVSGGSEDSFVLVLMR